MTSTAALLQSSAASMACRALLCRPWVRSAPELSWPVLPGDRSQATADRLQVSGDR